MTDDSQQLVPAPRQMSQDDFVARFGAIYEHSAWVAEQTWQRGLGVDHDTVSGLASSMASEVESAGEAAQMKLILAHPDLGGNAAVAGKLTDESASEQAGAGLDACTPEEYERLQQLNAAYLDKFGFPFIVAVKGLQREDILAAMAQRLENDQPSEQRRALDEIHKIARLRLRNL